MKRQIFTLVICALFCMAQMVHGQSGVIKKATTAPVIDGTIDAVWAEANTYTIDLPFQSEVPSLGASGTTNWKALWNSTGIFVLLQVNDDVFSPVYTGNTPAQAWMYDHPEIYFDVNKDLQDGSGPQTDGNGNGNGHYQFAPGFIEDSISVGVPMTTGANGATYSFNVSDPTYIAEYFIPFSKLVDKDGAEVIKTATIGFDVTIIDDDVLDPVRDRAVWANIGGTNESWVTMDDCGTVTLEGADAGVMVTGITVLSAGDASTIEVEAGTLQMSADILPADASVKAVKWTVTNGTGKATISADGLLTGVLNGTVTVTATAKDGSGISGSIEITIWHQIVTLMDLSVIKDGGFDTDGPISGAWGMWSGNGGTAEVIGGICTMMPLAAAEVYQLQVTQTGWEAYNDTSYVLTFTAWADDNRDFVIDFEDNEAHGYLRYGTSSDPESNGTCEWRVPLTPDPTTFTFYTTLAGLDETSTTKVAMFTSDALGTVYVDDISIVKESDIARVSNAVHSMSGVKVTLYPNPVANELNVNLSSSNSRITIYNSLGHKMDEVLIKGKEARINVSSYAKGLYFVKVNNDTVKKFVK